MRHLPSGPDPELFVVSPDGALIYVANEDDNMVTVVDVASRTALTEIPVGVEPEGMGISPDGKWLVNTSETTNMAHFIDTDTSRSSTTCWSTSARALPSGPPTAQVWVTAEIGGTVSVIDNATRQIKHKIGFEVPGVPRRSDPAGRRARSPRTRKWRSWRSDPPIVSR